MKLKQRYFDGTAFKKDITRFAPLWALYLIGALMLALPIINQQNWLPDAVDILSETLGYCALSNLVYAMLCAQLLYGDMYNSKLCNALHAMPLRREGWFLTHLYAGLLFSLGPNTILALSIMPMLGTSWYTALLWLLGMQLHYLFFFGLAVFSMHCTGNRFASIMVYAILNFLAMLVYWFLEAMYVPMLYGIQLSFEPFILFCPLLQLLIRDKNYFSVSHAAGCGCGNDRYWKNPQYPHVYQWDGMGGGWGYLVILAVLGVVLLAAALLLYRRRQLETAGSFVAFRVMRPIFAVLFTLCAGGGMQILGSAINGYSSVGSYIFLTLGLICGYFVGQMLICRTTKVFRRRTFLWLGIFLAAFALSLGLTRIDILGLTRYVPDADQVEQVYFSDYSLSDRDLTMSDEDMMFDHRNILSTKNPALIQQVLDAHHLLLQARPSPLRDTESFFLIYRLKSGALVRRVYTPNTDTQACAAGWDLLDLPKAFLGGLSLETLKAYIGQITINGEDLSTATEELLLEALWADAQAGALNPSYHYHRAEHGESDSILVEISLFPKHSNVRRPREVNLWPCCENLLAYLRRYEPFSLLFPWYSYQKLPDSLSSVQGPYCTLGGDKVIGFLYRLQTDFVEGCASTVLTERHTVSVRLELSDGESAIVYLDPKTSGSFLDLKPDSSGA